nr:hypothetical protein [uncultured Desulfobulbus sp.]
MKVRKRGFSTKEAIWVQGYIERKFGLHKTWPNEEQRDSALEAFEAIGNGQGIEREIYLWCRSWLSTDQRRRLKSTLGTWRHHQSKTSATKKRITLDEEAWLYLTTLAKYHGITVSDLIIDRLKKDYRSVNNP